MFYHSSISKNEGRLILILKFLILEKGQIDSTEEGFVGVFRYT